MVLAFRMRGFRGFALHSQSTGASQLNVIYPVLDRIWLWLRFQPSPGRLCVEWIYVGVPYHEAVLPPGHIRDRHEVQYKRRCLLGENMFLPESLRRFLLAQECAEHGGCERAAFGVR